MPATSTTSTPIGLILVSSGSRGEKLLFRYPYQDNKNQEHIEKARQSNPYALPTQDDGLNYFTSTTTIANDSVLPGKLDGFSDKILPVILCNTSLCGKKFELTVDDVKFVGHPTAINERDSKTLRKSLKSTKREESTMTMFSLVFVLHDNADVSVTHCYHDLCKRIALALKHEERRCGYLSHQAKIMLAVHDEVTAMPEDSSTSPYGLMLSRSKLCEDLQNVYIGLCETGVARVHINNWIEVSFCLPHKVHKVDQMRSIRSDIVEKSLAAIRPYHAMLLLEEESSLIMSLPPDCSPSLVRIIKLATPLKSLQQLSQDGDIALSQVFQLVGHLVYWGKATVIFPLCETNIYILSPQAPTSFSPTQLVDFNSKFPQFLQFPLAENLAQHAPLIATLSEFSLPTPLSDHTSLLGHDLQKGDLVKLVVWLLKRRLLVQIHTYIFIVPMHQEEDSDTKSGKHVGKPLVNFQRLEVELKLSTSDAVSVESDDITTATSTSFDTFSTRSTEDNQGAMYHGRTMEILFEYLSKEERTSLCRIPAANSSDDLKLFARLCPYFRGQHHLEEIMYLENVNRSQLHTILDKFSQVLFTCVHEDAATITYKEFL